MTERNTRTQFIRSDASPTASRTPHIVLGALVAVSCAGYAAWCLVPREGDSSSPRQVHRLLEASPPLSPTPAEPVPTAHLTLDRGDGAAELPVVNAHLEVSEGNEGSASVIDISPAVRQLGYSSPLVGTATPPADDRPAGAVAAWLTGTIETLPEGSSRAEAAAPYRR